METTIAGYNVKIDPDDAEFISDHKWVAVRSATNNPQGRVYFHRYIKTVNGTVIREYLHRDLLKCPSGMCIDLINRDTLDCRKANLRLCTHTINMINRSMQKNNTSGVIGVQWCESRNKWRARIVVNKKTLDLGYYHNKEDAISARREAEAKYGYSEIYEGNHAN